MGKWSLGLTLVFGLLYAGGEWIFRSDILPMLTLEVPISPAPNANPSVEAPAPVKAKESKALEHTFKRGDSLFSVLSLLGVSTEESFDILKSAQKVYDLKKIIPGQKIKVVFTETSRSVGLLLYEIDPLRLLKVARSDGGFQAVEEKAILVSELESRGGAIADSLFESARRLNVPTEVIMDMADIFAWDLDFSQDIQPGASFRVVYEVFKKEGVLVRTGKVLAAELVNGGAVYKGYSFGPEGEKGAYFNEKGDSLKKAFMKSPLRYRYISSGFTTHRLHPILKVNRPHLGVDFAAPYGTPVMAAGEGVITFAGWHGGHGKAVIVKHRNGYSTLYGHLSSFGAGIRIGKRVEQGDLVGRVGSTGLSTGPHLHYTLMKDGTPINPKRADVVPGEPISEKWRGAFYEQVEKMNRVLHPAKADETKV